MYRGGCKIVAYLKKAVEKAIRRAHVATCRAVMENARKRAELCLRENGDFLEQVLQMGSQSILTPATMAQQNSIDH